MSCVYELLARTETVVALSVLNKKASFYIW